MTEKLTAEAIERLRQRFANAVSTIKLKPAELPTPAGRAAHAKLREILDGGKGG